MVDLRPERHGLLPDMLVRHTGLAQLIFSRMNDRMALPRAVHLREALGAGRLRLALVLLSEEAGGLLVLVLVVETVVVIVYAHPGVVFTRRAATNASGVLRKLGAAVAIVQQGTLYIVGPPLCVKDEGPIGA